MSVDPVAKIQSDLTAGKPMSAFKKARTEAKKHPKLPLFQNLAGLCLAEAGDHAAAAPYFHRAYKLAPQDNDVRCNLAQAMIMSGQAATAETLIGQALEQNPEIARLHYLSAMIRMRESDFRQVITATDRALALAPQMTEALNMRGLAKSELQRSEAALLDFQEVLRLRPGNLLALQNCGERLNELGRTDEAVRHFRAILQSSPGHGLALTRLAALVPVHQLPEIAAAVQEALDRRPKDANELALLHAAAGTAHARSGAPGEAIGSFTKAHDIDARQKRYAPAEAQRNFEHIRRLFAGAPLPACAVADPVPVFVVGLPRSGTTLVEMILSAGPGVVSCGELVAAERLYRAMFRQESAVTGRALQHYAARYREALPDMPAGTAAFVDKMPANYRLLGLLLSAFPNARVVNLERDPRDVALSLWMKRFYAPGMAFASRLSWIADQANLYKRYMQMWEQSFPGMILTIRYEDLVRDLDAHTRLLAGHCGITWSEAMLRPDLNRSAVRTASVNQVREKVHARSVQKWGLLGGQLAELTDALDPTLWPLEAEPQNG